MRSNLSSLYFLSVFFIVFSTVRPTYASLKPRGNTPSTQHTAVSVEAAHRDGYQPLPHRSPTVECSKYKEIQFCKHVCHCTDTMKVSCPSLSLPLPSRSGEQPGSSTTTRNIEVDYETHCARMCWCSDSNGVRYFLGQTKEFWYGTGWRAKKERDDFDRLNPGDRLPPGFY
jgi:hypothetical protein